ncbi:MAG TPA: hypothetical protein VMW60_03945, partial [Dehalococcoidales bacterium]|nr:hypothetical protein [Dehalococcoidales bacterium]
MELSFTSWLIAGYVGLSMCLTQVLYVRYMKNTPGFKGRIPMGMSFEGNFEVGHKCSYWFAVVLFVVSVLIVIWQLSLLPEIGSFTVVKLIKSSGYLLLASVLLVMLSHFLGTSATKLSFNLSTIGMMYLALYASIASVKFEFIIQFI